MSCGFTARTTIRALIAAAFEVSPRSRASRQLGRALLAPARGDEVAQSELRSPAMSDSPILPAPRIAIRTHRRRRTRPRRRSGGEEVHAREAGPATRRTGEQRVGLLGLDAGLEGGRA
jgi:hypothetical protein